MYKLFDFYDGHLEFLCQSPDLSIIQAACVVLDRDTYGAWLPVLYEETSNGWTVVPNRRYR